MEYRAVAEAFQSPSFQTTVEQAVYKYVAELQIFVFIATNTSIAPIVSVPVARCARTKHEKTFLERTNTEETFVDLADAVDETKNKCQFGIPRAIQDSVRFASPQRLYLTTRRTFQTRTVRRRILMSGILAFTEAVAERGVSDPFLSSVITTSQHPWCMSKSPPSSS